MMAFEHSEISKTLFFYLTKKQIILYKISRLLFFKDHPHSKEDTMNKNIYIILGTTAFIGFCMLVKYYPLTALWLVIPPSICYLLLRLAQRWS